MNCEFCQSPVHIWFDCPKKPVGWKPARLANKTADGLPRAKGVISSAASTGLEAKPSAVGLKVTGAQKASLTSEPVDTKFRALENEGVNLSTSKSGLFTSLAGVEGNIDRQPKFDKAAWMRQNMPAYMKRYRAEVKSGLRVPKPRTGVPS